MRERRWRHTNHWFIISSLLPSPMVVPVSLPRSLSLPPATSITPSDVIPSPLPRLQPPLYTALNTHPTPTSSPLLLSPTLYFFSFFSFSFFSFYLTLWPPWRLNPMGLARPISHQSTSIYAPCLPRLHYVSSFFSFFRMQLAFPILTALSHRSHLIHNQSSLSFSLIWRPPLTLFSQLGHV